MREGAKTLIVACVALLLVLGLAACGSDDASDATDGGAGNQAQGGAASGGGSSQGNGGNAGGSGAGNSKAESDGSSPSASDFVPKQHEDSGGGSAQFKVKGGDNSVQEFGEEADESDFEAAAAAVHNFLDARAEQNWAAVCGYMSKSQVESFEQLAAQSKQAQYSSCAGIVGALTNPAAAAELKEEAKRADVRSLRVEGDQAFAIYTGLAGTVLAMPLANEDGEWKVASFAGTPLN